MPARRFNQCLGDAEGRAAGLIRRTFVTMLCLLWFVTVGSPLSAGPRPPPAPQFDPVAWFEGPLQSAGTITLRWGQPRRFKVSLLGRRQGNVLLLRQHFVYADGKTLQRDWRIRRVGRAPDGAVRYDATGSDVVGVASGYATGDTFRWSYLLQGTPGNPLTRVRMDHRMRLGADGRTLDNAVRISRFGIPLGSVTETFWRGNVLPH